MALCGHPFRRDDDRAVFLREFTLSSCVTFPTNLDQHYVAAVAATRVEGRRRCWFGGTLDRITRFQDLQEGLVHREKPVILSNVPGRISG
jgi:hypothetical protein